MSDCPDRCKDCGHRVVMTVRVVDKDGNDAMEPLTGGSPYLSEAGALASAYADGAVLCAGWAKLVVKSCDDPDPVVAAYVADA